MAVIRKPIVVKRAVMGGGKSPIKITSVRKK